LNGSCEQFVKAFEHISLFRKMSGCKNNMKKSQAFHIRGNNKPLTTLLADMGLQWPKGFDSCLGIKLPVQQLTNDVILFNLNFDSHKFATILNL